MERKTMGELIAQLRREQGMTQRQLAEKLGVTDKAVSKWERDLACPDTMSLAPLAELLGIGVEELLRAKGTGGAPKKTAVSAPLILKAIALAMGVAVAVTALLGSVEPRHAFTMLGLGLSSLALLQLQKE